MESQSRTPKKITRNPFTDEEKRKLSSQARKQQIEERKSELRKRIIPQGTFFFPT